MKIPDGPVLFLQRAGGRVVKHTPELLGAAAFVVTSLSSEAYAHEQEIVDDMLRLRLDLSSNRVDPMKRQEFAELFLELLENRWGEAAEIQKRTPWMWMATHHEVGDALIDAWMKLSKDMPRSNFR